MKRQYWGVLQIAGILSFLMTWIQLAFTWENASLKFVTITGFWLIVSVLVAIYGNFRLLRSGHSGNGDEK